MTILSPTRPVPHPFHGFAQRRHGKVGIAQIFPCPILSATSHSEDEERVGNHNRLGPKDAVRPSEQGYVILFAIFLLALLVIALAIAAPQVAKSIQRDKDLETYNRGLQYRRAIKLYYKKFNAYPPSVDALVQTNNIRFLRKKYIDPITGKDDWKPILFGQNKVPTALGFFGQPLAGGATTVAGIGPGGGNGGGSGGGILPGGISDILGGGPSSSPSSSNPTSGPTDNFGTPIGNTSSPGTNTPGGPSTGDTGSTPGSSSGSDQSGQNGQAGQSGQTFGGAGIIGFKPSSERQSILIYKKKDHYNEWEFTYDPISEMKTIGGGSAGTIGQPASSTSTQVGTPTFGTGTSTTTSSTTTTQ
jgi:type II secretory pathway pseudopilin PulG